jgi:glycosyltransferase involved in cell wall biosynthesis
MRILVFSHYYPPEVNAPAARISQHCRVWAREGHDVTVVTCAPNHPTGNVYSGYRNRAVQSEVVDGVRVVRVWTLLAQNRDVARRSLNFISYFISASLLLPWLPRPDIIISTSPQFFCGLVGAVARLFKRAPWVLEVRDLWPESIHAVGAIRKGFTTRALEWLERFAYRRADRIVAVSSAFVPHIAERTNDAFKIDVVTNGVDLIEFDPDKSLPDSKSQLGLTDKFVAVYAGTLGMAHGVTTILDAAERLRHDRRIAFLLVGDGAEREKILAERERRQLDNVIVLGQRPRDEIPAILKASDVALVMLRRCDAFTKVLPSKMFEAMAMRRPIILGVEGEARRLLERAQAGIAITPECAEDLAATLRQLANDHALAQKLGAQGADYVRAHHNREQLALRYLRLLSGIVAQAKSTRPSFHPVIRR